MIGERLYDLRKDFNLTQDELAEILKINKHSISSYERDKSEPPDIIKIRIAKFFSVSIDYLLGITNNPNSYDDNRHQIIKLPKDFPESAKQSLYDYILFLNNKNKGT